LTETQIWPHTVYGRLALKRVRRLATIIDSSSSGRFTMSPMPRSISAIAARAGELGFMPVGRGARRRAIALTK